MDNRLRLHEELCALLGSRSVYFQPPESLRLKYPCIVYEKEGVSKQNANNKLYMSTDRYTITVIDQDPDSDVEDRILEYFPMCQFDRSFSSDGLNHSIFTLYY